jgi:DNA (cytosine-5)-methyltransferase 1
VDTTEELPTVISFCSGYAGIERGLDLVGINHRVIAYVEIEAFAIANLVSKMESGQLDPAPIYTDLKTFPGHLFRDCVDIITGGYPCQPFSAAGKRLGEKDPRHLWPYIREHIHTIQPARVFLENVEGHISMGLSSVISDLEEDGYGATWGIFSAREVGAPHQRKRVYILADCKGQLGKWSKSERAGAGQPEKEVGDRGSVVADCNGVRCDWGALSNGDSERSLEVEALEGSEQPLVRSEAEGCSGDSGGELADTESQRVQGLRASGEQEPGAYGETELPVRQGQRPQQANWEPEPRVGRVVDGCADRVDRIRLLGNGVVPQTAAKAWQVLSSRLEGL